MAGKHALKTAKPKNRWVDTTTVTRVLKHPATAPTAVTVVAIALVMGLGWLNQTNEVGPASLATPLAEGGTITSGGGTDDGRADTREPDIGEPVLATRGRRAVLVPTWMDLPLVTPALAARPDAIETLIPGAEPTTVPTGSGSGGSSGSGSGSGTTGTTRPGTGTSTPGTGSGTTGTTVAGSTPTTAPPDTTATTDPPDTTPSTDPPDTTATTDPPDTTATTEPPPTTDVTIPPASETPGGLLDVVDGLLGTLTPALEPLPLL